MNKTISDAPNHLERIKQGKFWVTCSTNKRKIVYEQTTDWTSESISSPTNYYNSFYLCYHSLKITKRGGVEGGDLFVCFVFLYFSFFMYVWKFSLRFQGPKLFNSLSTKLQNDSNIAVFISKLKSSFLVQVYFTCLSVLVCAFFAFFFCLPLLLRVCGFSFAELLFIILCAVDSIYILLLSLAWV